MVKSTFCPTWFSPIVIGLARSPADNLGHNLAAISCQPVGNVS
ncbi:hypothetical protein [Halomicronema sp. CCY15110]|nr:hypothetical protein [Halomicronema sp. CCY15110]